MAKENAEFREAAENGEHGGKEKRERRREDRRDQLLDVATRLFSKYGLEGTTTKDIAKAAQVSPGLLYHYYASKEDLLVDVVKRFRDQTGLEKVIIDNDYGPVREAFLRILTAFKNFFEQHIDEIWLISRAAARFPQVQETLRSFRENGRDAFAEFLIRRVEAGDLVNLNNPKRLAGTICQTLVGEQLMQVADRDNLESLVDILLYGMTPR